MRQIIQIGKPTHLRVKSVGNETACGLIGITHMARAAYDPRDVDCCNCKKTKAYRRGMGKK